MGEGRHAAAARPCFAVPCVRRARAEAAAWLRARMTPGDLVLVSPALTHGYAVWAGLPQVWVDGMAERFGFPQEREQRRQDLLDNLAQGPDPLLAARIRWMVVDDPRGPLAALVQRWVRDGRAAPRATFQQVVIIELLRPESVTPDSFASAAMPSDPAHVGVGALHPNTMSTSSTSPAFNDAHASP